MSRPVRASLANCFRGLLDCEILHGCEQSTRQRPIKTKAAYAAEVGRLDFHYKHVLISTVGGFLLMSDFLLFKFWISGINQSTSTTSS